MQKNIKKVQKMDTLIKNITNYLSYLSESTSLIVSVHFKRNVYEYLDERITVALIPHHSHRSLFCMAVKKHADYYERCLRNQQNIARLLEGVESLEISCYAGAKEIAYPIKNDGKVIGFVTASGYAGEKNEDILPHLYDTALSKEDIPRKEIDALLPPLCSMIELAILKSGASEPSEISRMLKYISDNVRTVTLDSIAHEFGRSRSYVSHTFKRKTGRSIRAYCNALKLDEGQKLIASTNLSITEIAMEVGFDDAAYFIRLFKENFGMTPYQYRITRRIR